MNLKVPSKDDKIANHLLNESSPYLLAHAYNPVHWYPWGREALDRARNEDKPIFLSIGYSACHWCHVMEEESFENDEIARILNENYISIKVDREQRPDIDQIYMTAVSAMTGSGGWPLSVFLTPDLKPFFGGTYFPPDDRYRRPGFRYVISELAASYKTERAGLEEMAGKIVDALRPGSTSPGDSVVLDKSLISNCIRALMNNFDPFNGGFGRAPKFPHPTELSFMLKYAFINKEDTVLNAARKSLDLMARGGIYDHLGGGFHRYSTDARWLVPHFEKMLYDNALLAITYADAYQITKSGGYERVVRHTLDFILRELTDKDGGFFSSLDADSEGHEGKFYTWKKSEIEWILGAKAEIFCHYYNVSDDGNFEDSTNIFNIDSTSDQYIERLGINEREFQKTLNDARAVLFEVREKRVRPGLDDKILTSWNGLAISALSRGFQVTREERYRDAAVKAANFIKDNLYDDGELTHAWRSGVKSEGQFLEDYAYLSAGLLDLYETVYDYSWVEMATRLAEKALNYFTDSTGDFYLAVDNPKEYFIRPHDVTDGALPAPGSIMIQTLLRLSEITGDKKFLDAGEQGLKAAAGATNQLPHAMTSAVSALDFLLSERKEIVLVGLPGREPFVDALYDFYIPNRAIIVSDQGEEQIPLLEGRNSNGRATAYVCRNFACGLPVIDAAIFREELANL